MADNRQLVTRGKIYNGDYSVDATLIIDHNENSMEPVFCIAIIEAGVKFDNLVKGLICPL